MARAYQQSHPVDDDQDHNNPAEWQSLKRELMVLLDQVDNQVTRTRTPEPSRQSYAEPQQRYADPPRERFEPAPDVRHRDALRSVQRAISRFEEAMPAPSYPPNPRDSLQAAINQIRASQGQGQAPQPQRRMAPPPIQQTQAPAPQPAPRMADPAPLFDRLAQSVNGLSGRLEKLEGEIKAQIKTGANVKDVADQVSQLANVVELLAGAVGETGQVKRLEGQIASLGKIMSQGREMDIQTLTRRLDDVASTVGKLAELQVHYADRVQSPVDSQAFQDGMRSIEESVRAVYDRIDSLERQRSLAPQDLEHLSGEMARFTEALRDGQQAPMHLVELVDALNTRIADVESGDRLLHGLRKDLSALRDSVIVALTPRFDAIEQRMDTLSTRDDMAEIGRQIGALTDRIGERPIDPGLGQLEAQVRLLVARMDQTGEQLSGLAKLYSSPAESQVMMPDFDAVADLVASRTAEAVQRQPVSMTPAPMDPAIHDTIARLEDRIATMLSTMHRDPEVDAFDGMQAGITEVNERLKRLEMSLMERSTPPRAEETIRRSDIASIIADAEEALPVPRPRVDTMPRSPAEDAPLNAPAFPEPVGPVAQALDAKNGPRKRHPGLGEDVPLAARYDAPAAPAAPAGFDPEGVERPAAPQPSFGFADAAASAPKAAVSPEVAPAATARTNTFIEAARRAAQRQTAAKPEPQSNSLIGRALSRFQSSDVAPAAALAKPEPKAKKDKKVLAGDKPARTEFKPEPPPMTAGADAAVATASLEPAIGVDQHGASIEVKQSFLTRHRRAILLGALVVAVGFLTANFIAQRMLEGGDQAQPAAPAPTEAPAPATTGSIGQDVVGAPVLGAQSIPPRVIPMAESSSATGSINSQAFTKDAAAPTSSAFAAATQVANADPNSTTPAVAPLTPDTPSPIKVEMPPENVGPQDLRQAASDGDARAQFEVAAIYTEGRAVPQDYKAAATWYERAAAQGFAPAQYRLGSLYENGNGVTKDLNTARLWYERAAEAGNRMSMHNLAALYAGGQLGKQQFDSAAKWFEEAANRGLTDSQFNLGMLYARGLGVAQSMPESYKWFSLAAKSGDKDATKARDDIARSLDPATVTKITAEVDAFKPQAIDLKANFAPIGSWSKTFDPGETITTRDIVSSVQKALGKLGYDVGTPDGIAGAKTKDAIKAFEAATGMSQVGQINPRLLAVLGSQPV